MSPDPPTALHLIVNAIGVPVPLPVATKLALDGKVTIGFPPAPVIVNMAAFGVDPPVPLVTPEIVPDASSVNTAVCAAAVDRRLPKSISLPFVNVRLLTITAFEFVVRVCAKVVAVNPKMTAASTINFFMACGF